MLADLCLAKTETAESSAQYRNLVRGCMQQGYGTIATNKNFCDLILTPKETCTLQPVQTSTLELSKEDIPTNQPLNQLSRITLEISEPRFLQQFNDTSKILSTYDLIAIKPKNDKIFHSICIEYDYYDIITFDMGQKIPFMLKRSPVYEAIRKGKYFEISYNALFDSTKKRTCLTNCINIIKATKGKNLIVTSDVSSQIFHRSAIDLCSLLVTLGMSRDKALMCIRDTPDKCVKSARNRKTFKGIIEIVGKEEADKLVETASKIIEQNKQLPKQINQKCVREVFKSRHSKKLEKMKAKLEVKQKKILKPS